MRDKPIVPLAQVLTAEPAIEQEIEDMVQASLSNFASRSDPAPEVETSGAGSLLGWLS